MQDCASVFLSHSRSYGDGKTCAILHFKISPAGRYKKFTLTSLDTLEAIHSSFTYLPCNSKLLISLSEYRVYRDALNFDCRIIKIVYYLLDTLW